MCMEMNVLQACDSLTLSIIIINNNINTKLHDFEYYFCYVDVESIIQLVTRSSTISMLAEIGVVLDKSDI